MVRSRPQATTRFRRDRHTETEEQKMPRKPAAKPEPEVEDQERPRGAPESDYQDEK